MIINLRWSTNVNKKIIASIIVLIFIAISSLTFSQDQYMSSKNEQIQWICSLQTQNGAIKDSNQPAKYDPLVYKITPYYANIAAEALTTSKESLPNVKKYINWYFAHLNWPDEAKMNDKDLYGTIYDYYIDEKGIESCSFDYDSADSYAATFLSLIRSYYEASNDLKLIEDNKERLASIGNIMVTLMDQDSLTYAKQDYLIKYLMDNCEVYKGLIDASFIFEKVLKDYTLSAYFHTYAMELKKSINSLMQYQNQYYVYKDLKKYKEVDWSIWYPDSVSQLFPVLFDVISPESDNAKYLFNMFCEKWEWENLNGKNDYPWILVGYISVKMEKSSLAKTFYNNINQKYLKNKKFENWNSMEAAWYIHLCDSLSRRDTHKLSSYVFFSQLKQNHRIFQKLHLLNPHKLYF